MATTETKVTTASTDEEARHAQGQELDQYLQVLMLEDQALTLALEKEREIVESSIEKMHRMNNFRIDEAHVREANIAEGQFLIDRQDKERSWLEMRQEEEAKSLKEEEDDRRMLELIARESRGLKLAINQKKEAGEKVAVVKRKVAERRQALAARLATIELRQERERKTLMDTHARILKDVELDKIASGTEGAGGLASSVEAQKIHEAKMLQLKLRMQKEVEQLREEHLLKLKHMTKLCDLELEQVDDMENLYADQKVQELELEASQRKEMDAEEDQINTQQATFKAFETTRQLQLKAARTQSQQRQEARHLIRQQKIAAKHRERQFFESEEALIESLRGLTQEERDNDATASQTGDESGKGKSSAGQSMGMSSDMDGSEYSDMTTDTELVREVELTGGTSQELETQLLRNRERIEAATKKHTEAIDILRVQQQELREQMKRDHNEALKRLLGEQEDEYKQLKTQHHLEMEMVLKGQNAADALEADNEISNNLLYGMLPRYVADQLKMGNDVEPRDFPNLTILQADIVQFTNLTVRSSPNQIVNLLNRLYTAFDNTLDDYKDLYKTETVGDAYQVVAGLNTAGESAADAQRNAMDMADCALRFLSAVRKLDMTDQIQPDLLVRIGIHTGHCVAGVAGKVMPKFAIFGDTVNIASQLEQKSRPNKILVSEATYEMIKDAFVFEKHGNVAIEGGVTTSTYWLLDRKAAPKDGSKGSVKMRTGGSGQGDRVGRGRVSVNAP
ncbi:Nitrogen permease regulator 2 [Borealophlyctis nickersoniae]|nr:Nitrogen permease regulator 2 [Borealophlyctis nickersoniae]